MKALARTLGMVAALCLFASAQDTGKIFVVRHAEKQSNADDALLSSAGQARAECLGQTLKDAHISSVLVTRYERTKQTAAAVVRESSAKEQTFEPKDYAAIVAAANSAAASGNVLIVGHSNTIPALLSTFGTPQVTVPDAAFDQLFIFYSKNPKNLIVLHYCPNLSRGEAVGSGGAKM